MGQETKPNSNKKPTKLYAWHIIIIFIIISHGATAAKGCWSVLKCPFSNHSGAGTGFVFRTAVSVLAVLEQHTAIQIANSKHTEVIHCQCINIGDPTKLHSVTCNKIHFPKQSAFEERRGWKTHLLVYPYRQKPTSPSKHGKDLCKLVGKTVYLTVRGALRGDAGPWEASLRCKVSPTSLWIQWIYGWTQTSLHPCAALWQFVRREGLRQTSGPL